MILKKLIILFISRQISASDSKVTERIKGEREQSRKMKHVQSNLYLKPHLNKGHHVKKNNV